MKIRDEALQYRLAAEYVLGTLGGRARRRFETLAAGDPALHLAVHRWEAHLARLGLALTPVAPPPEVWSRLAERLAGAPGKVTPMRRPGLPPETPKPPARPPSEPPRSPPLWRIFAGLATAAAMVLAVIVGQRVPLPKPAPGPQAVTLPPLPAPAGPTYVALLKLPDADLQWTLSLVPARGRVIAVASGSDPKLGDHSLELWAITPAGPVSLGLLPITGRGELKLPAGVVGDEAPTLAVSLEPQGGSPTGKPTGPVLTSGKAAPTA